MGDDEQPAGDKSRPPLPPVPRFSEKAVMLPVDRHLIDLGKTVAVGATKRDMVVLPEDAYLEGMSQILRRDFFPELSRLEAEEQYLLAMEQQDKAGMRAATRQFQRLEQLEGLVGVGGLNEYRAAVTSEDNASFEALVERENRARRKKYEKVYGGPALLVDDPSRKLLLMPSRPDSAKIRAERLTKHTVAANTRIRPPRMRRDLMAFGDQTDAEDIHRAYQEIMQRHHRDADCDDTRSVSTAGTAAQYDMVAGTPVVRPGIDGTPLMTWGAIEGTPQRLQPTPARRAGPATPLSATQSSSAAARRMIVSSLGRQAQSSAPFSFETKSTRSKRASDEMMAALQSPIIPRTPKGSTTPQRHTTAPGRHTDDTPT